jgi:hypothetical protein
MSSDQTLFRGRLTGTIIEDTSDASPAGEKGALVTYAREDTWPAIGDGVELGVARVMLPNAIPCPIYAAKLAFWHTVGTVPVLTPDVQPRVIVRRDLVSTGPATTCQSIVISLPILAAVVERWPDTVKEVLQGEFAKLLFSDVAGNTVSPQLGYLPVVVGTPALVSAETMVACFTRVPASAVVGIPSGYLYTWVIQGAGIQDHRHLRPGPGVNGGGPAFAAFAPFTTAEATGLGYVL